MALARRKVGEGVNPYRTLGVKKSATDKEIRDAYHRAAMRHHPDRGGDREKFEAAHKAYEILRDPDRRSRYDRTGDTSFRAPPPEHADTMAFLSPIMFEVVNQLASQGSSGSAIDLLKHVVSAVDQVKNGLAKDLASLKKQVAFLYKSLGRFKRKDGGETLIDGALKSQLSRTEAAVAERESSLKAASKALEFLAEHSYDYEKSLHGPTLPSKWTSWGNGWGSSEWGTA